MQRGVGSKMTKKTAHMVYGCPHTQISILPIGLFIGWYQPITFTFSNHKYNVFTLKVVFSHISFFISCHEFIEFSERQWHNNSCRIADLLKMVILFSPENLCRKEEKQTGKDKNINHNFL